VMSRALPSFIRLRLWVAWGRRGTQFQTSWRTSSAALFSSYMGPLVSYKQESQSADIVSLPKSNGRESLRICSRRGPRPRCYVGSRAGASCRNQTGPCYFKIRDTLTTVLGTMTQH
jgi:hypothetical protein